MTRFILPLAILALAGCSQKAQNEAATAANTMSADANATMAKAVKDTDAVVLDHRVPGVGVDEHALVGPQRLGVVRVQARAPAAEAAVQEVQRVAADQAFGAAENGMDKIGNAATDARKKAGQAAKDVGNEIED